MFLILITAVCGCGGMMLFVVAPVGEMVSLGQRDYRRQCEIAVGPETGTTATTTATVPVAPSPVPQSTSPRPTANPYASLTLEPDDPNVTDRDHACVAAMRSAPWQDQPIRSPNTGPAATCAADLALRYVEVGGTAVMADYVRDVVYSASIVTTTGQCAPIRAPASVAEESCGDPAKGSPAVILPETVGAAGYCGQLVDPEAASPGDVVFWDYRDNAATRAAIALGPRELVTVESGKFVRIGIPEGAEIQIKRVLGEAR